MRIALFPILALLATPALAQPEFSKPQPKIPRVTSGCSSPTCWYLCSVTKLHGQLARGPSFYETAKYDYTDGDFARDLAQSVATSVGRAAHDVKTWAIAYFDSAADFSVAAQELMRDPEADYFITGVCRK
jgi:hypothetical protein